MKTIWIFSHNLPWILSFSVPGPEYPTVSESLCTRTSVLSVTPRGEEPGSGYSVDALHFQTQQTFVSHSYQTHPSSKIAPEDSVLPKVCLSHLWWRSQVSAEWICCRVDPERSEEHDQTSLPDSALTRCCFWNPPTRARRPEQTCLAMTEAESKAAGLILAWLERWKYSAVVAGFELECSGSEVWSWIWGETCWDMDECSQSLLDMKTGAAVPSEDHQDVENTQCQEGAVNKIIWMKSEYKWDGYRGVEEPDHSRINKVAQKWTK